MATKKKLKSVTSKAVSREAAEAAVRTLIQWSGEDPDREGLLDTPRRVVKAFEEYYEGYRQKPEDFLKRTFSETGGYHEAVLVKDIAFESRCEHHLAPFIGKASVAYIPDGRVVGLSKIARLVDIFARRMQVQERLTTEIAEALFKNLKCKGVAVFLEAEHFCMKVRGVKKHDALTVTHCFLGAYEDNTRLRKEFLLQVKG